MKTKNIAVVGASRARHKFGNKCVRAYLAAGYGVFPVNLHEKEVEGLAVLATLSEISEPLDRISIYLVPATTRQLLPQLQDFRDTEIWFNPGSADPKIIDLAREMGLRVVDGCSIVDIGRSPSEFP